MCWASSRRAGAMTTSPVSAGTAPASTYQRATKATRAWVWIGVEDVEKLYEELKANGAKIRQEPTNYPWALEIRVEDRDGNVLRMGSEPKEDRPYQAWRP